MSLLDTLPSVTGDGVTKPAASRDAAIALLRATGLPTKKTEAWRFTSVKSIVERAIPVSPTSLTPPHTDVVRFVGGHPVLPTAPRSPAVSLARVTQSSLLGAFEPESAHPFAALNTALFSDALVVKVKGVAARPVFVDHVAFENERADTAAYARIRVELAANAELVLVERYRGASALSDSVVEIVLGENAKLVHLRTHEDEGALVGSVFVRQARGSRYVSHALSFYGAPTRLDLCVRLEGEGAECSLDGVALVAGDAHSDHHVRVDHVAPRTTSRMRHRAVVSDRATSVFDGQAHVLPGAAGCEAHQHSRNLLLSDRGTVHTKPHLEIHVDEVVASHGATVGALDPDALFYLRARGISESNAKTLLTYAFLQELVDAIEHPALRTAMRDALLSQLPGGELVRALEDDALDFEEDHPTEAEDDA